MIVCDCTDTTEEQWVDVCENTDYYDACKQLRCGRYCGSCAPLLWELYIKVNNDPQSNNH